MSGKLDEILNEHEGRIKKLEESHDKDISTILSCLQTIESRLIGSIDDKSPGLLEEFRILKKDVEETRLRITNIESDIKELKQTAEGLTKYKFIIYGGIIVITWIISNIGGIWTFLTGFIN